MTDDEPFVQSRLKTLAAGGLTAVIPILCPYASASPARTSLTAFTPGVFFTASEAAIGIGVKLFCAVMA